MRMTGSRPDLGKAKQRGINQGERRRGMRNRRHAANRKAGLCFDKLRIGPAQPLAIRADQRLQLFFIHPLVARGHHQHRHIVKFAAKNNAFGNLADRNAQPISRLLRGAGGVIEHSRAVRMTAGLQHGSHALHALGQGFQLSTAHHAARRLSKAVATREPVLRCKKSLMNCPASIKASRSMPVSMPMPCSR